MLHFILVGGGFLIWFLVKSFEEHSKAQEIDRLLREDLKKRGIQVNWDKRLTYNDFKAIVKDM